MYVQVIICKKPGEFDEPLTYALPETMQPLCRIGSFLMVPLRGRTVQGIAVGLEQTLPVISADKIKPIDSVLSSPAGLFEWQVALARFIADYYRTTLARALRLLTPASVWSARPAKRKKLPVSAETAEPVAGSPVVRPVLTAEQEKALAVIEASSKPVLLHGVTGSGKTELYLRVVALNLLAGKSCILLVPEIALTPQTLDYFAEAFPGQAIVFHSRLSDKKRAENWHRVRDGKPILVIGSRSAVFAPVAHLGALILDEEHEWTYKQESAPYYETHRIAEWLHLFHGAKLIFGSATPRLESYRKAMTGDYALATLDRRVHQPFLPVIHVADLREEFKKKNFSIFSLILQKKMTEALGRGEQVILFVNQRGMARAVVCRDCGHAETCPHCAISLKYHAAAFGRLRDQLVCHYCQFTKNPPPVCPDCQSSYIRHLGVGTQKVEAETRRLFPQARVLRADRDTTGSAEGFAPIYRAFLKRECDVLIGTQMIAKGLDFSGVSLIGIVLADIGLHIPDFRSHERLFQLITQVAGRCGRSEEHPGEVVLQTYQPDHFAIAQAASYGYADFADQELLYREKGGYPPFGRLIKFTVAGHDEEALKNHIGAETQTLEDIFRLNSLPVKIMSAPAMVSRVADRFYYHVMLRGENPEIIFRHWRLPKGWRVDIDPVHTA